MVTSIRRPFGDSSPHRQPADQSSTAPSRGQTNFQQRRAAPRHSALTPRTHPRTSNLGATQDVRTTIASVVAVFADAHPFDPSFAVREAPWSITVSLKRVPHRLATTCALGGALTPNDDANRSDDERG